MMPQQDMGYGNGMPYSSPAPSAAPADAEAAWNRTTQQAQFAPGTDMVKAKQDFMQRYNPRPQQLGGMQQAAFMNNLLSGQQPIAGQTQIPASVGTDLATAPRMMPQQGLQEIDYNGPRSRYFDESPELNILATREAKYPTAGQTQIPTFAQPYVQKLQGGQQQSPEEYARQRGYAYEPPARGNQTWDQFQLTQGRGQQQGAQQAARYISPEERNAQDAYFRQDALVQAGNFNGGATRALAAGLGQPVAGQPSAPPVGGKGGGSSPTGRY
jgi:hypothetical protein